MDKQNIRLILPDEDAIACMELPRPDLELRQDQGQTMGTNWQCKVYVPPGMSLDIPDLMEPMFDQICEEMNHWDSKSLISRMNRSNKGEEFSLPHHFSTVLSMAIRIAEETDWAFNPCTYQQICSRGFGPEESTLQSNTITKNTFFDEQSRLFKQPGDIQLDLSAIAKGYAVDCMAETLIKQDFTHFLVEIGGEFVARGVKPNHEPWWIDIPPIEPHLPITRVALLNQALATSGTTIKTAILDTDHIIVADNEDNAPLRRISITAKTCILADAYATAQIALSRIRPISSSISIIDYAY